MFTLMLLVSMTLLATAALVASGAPRIGRPARPRWQVAAMTFVAVPVLTLGLAACSASSSSSPGSAAGAGGTSSSPSNSPTVPTPCTSDAILAALPGGATMQRYTCAQVGDIHWAAARVDPGNTVFFLKSNGHTWQAMTADSVCGTASAGLPQTLLAYCPT